MTGMGQDGTRDASVKTGGKVIAEDSSTCIVYGMPKSVIDSGYADSYRYRKSPKGLWKTFRQIFFLNWLYSAGQ